MRITDRCDEVRGRVEAACGRAGRSIAEVEIVVITKGRSDQAVLEAHAAGFRRFAENRAQALEARVGLLPAGATWDFVGHLQRNKVRLVRPIARLLQSMDRASLAKAWIKGPGQPPPVLLQVNIGREPQKSGVSPEEARSVVETCLDLGIEVRGLMAIPPNPQQPEDSRPFFAEMRGLRDRIAVDHPGVTELSMGMTDDFEVAVEEGATILRPGRAIFGPLHPGPE